MKVKAKPKTAKKLDSTTLEIAKTSIENVDDIWLPSTLAEGDILTELQPNSGKLDVTHPSLVGLVKFGELACSLALWRRDTKDMLRQYYACSVNDAVAQKEAWQRNKEKIEPLHRLKLYEFRQREATDPDFATTEPFIQDGKRWWGMMWVQMPDSNNVESFRYHLLFSQQRPASAWSNALKEDQSSGAERLKARRKELEGSLFYRQQMAKRQKLQDEDQVPM